MLARFVVKLTYNAAHGSCCGDSIHASKPQSCSWVCSQFTHVPVQYLSFLWGCVFRSIVAEIDMKL
jgi:hypothetical protein